jgi:hypothetical protein
MGLRELGPTHWHQHHAIGGSASSVSSLNTFGETGADERRAPPGSGTEMDARQIEHLGKRLWHDGHVVVLTRVPLSWAPLLPTPTPVATTWVSVASLFSRCGEGGA